VRVQSRHESVSAISLPGPWALFTRARSSPLRALMSPGFSGEMPGHLPVVQVTKVVMVVNLKAARALGIAVPLSLTGRADEVIE
jgi:hypothetical protein